jgi:methionyl-tRNA formyltransferase
MVVVQILVDNRDSWIIPYAEKLRIELNERGHQAFLLHKAGDVKRGDILFLLSCEKIFSELHLNKHNLVVHESALPKGKGWSPLTWQVLEGRNEITITLFEAEKKVDAGPIYYQEIIKLNGSELINELRDAQGKATIRLAVKFVSAYPNVSGIPQTGEATYYEKRKPEDSRLDVNKPLKEQFNLLRVVDNDRYPAFFEHKGIKYKILISKL